LAPSFLAYPFVLSFFSSFNSQVPSRSGSSAKIDDRILDRLSEVLDEHSDWLKAVEGILGFCKSSIVDDPVSRVKSLGNWRLRKDAQALLKPLKDTWSSTSLSKPEEMRRLVACVNFADFVRHPDVASSILEDIVPRDLHNIPRSIELGQVLQSQANRGQQKIGLCAQRIVAGIISNAESSNEHWVSLAEDQLGESEQDIMSYLQRGIGNRVTCQFDPHHSPDRSRS
jgi:hypothetical protein